MSSAERPELTTAGLEYARRAAPVSTVARVAILGYGAGWPDNYVRAAVLACNGAGERETSEPDPHERYFPALVHVPTVDPDEPEPDPLPAGAYRLTFGGRTVEILAETGPELIAESGSDEREPVGRRLETAAEYAASHPAPAPIVETRDPDRAPEWLAPELCAHGYASGCPDCDVPSYWPSALAPDEPEPADG